MEYETPEVTALVPAIDAIQGTAGAKGQRLLETPLLRDAGGAYQDWE